ncbi:MAG: tetratricopeptide repeat protein [Culturomica sp.]|jgi:tetratricopeptide (TPR) repeat protein|nr:tetratricopeptide repeat protein [Culturomica sp.]
MKRLTFILMILFCASIGFAQKGKVNQANSYLNAGKLDEAKKAIDEGINHEKTINDPNSYFVKAQIYQSIHESPIPAFKDLSPDALNIAYDAYKKAVELDLKGKISKKLPEHYKNLSADFINAGVDAYNKGNFTDAAKNFKIGLEIQNSTILNQTTPDTTVIFYTGMALKNAGDADGSIDYLKKALELNYEAARCYALLANIYKEKGNKEEALKYLNEGYKKYPESAELLVELINFYLSSDEPGGAEKFLDAAIAQDPTNSSFYTAKGALLERTGNLEGAAEMYKKSLELDPKNFQAQYNFGVVELNKVSEHHKKVNDIMDVEEYNKGIKEVYAEYEAVIPYFEKAATINPESKETLQILKELYFKLRNENPDFQKRYDEVNAKLEKM